MQPLSGHFPGVPDSPVIGQNSGVEGYLQADDATRLFYQTWSPSQPRGTLLITHGQGEHSQCYRRLRDGLGSLNLRVIGWDLRGHGKSDGKRGYARHFSDYTSDLDRVVRHVIAEDLVIAPFYMLGHSLGGLIQMSRALEDAPLPVEAMVFSAPFFGLSLSIPAAKELLARALRALLPRVTFPNELRRDLLSRDPEVLEEYEKDSLRHARISPGAYLGAMARIRSLESGIATLRYRSLFQIPAADPICDSESTRRLVKRIDCSLGCRLHEYPDRRHEIYNDQGREEAFADLVGFLR